MVAVVGEPLPIVGRINHAGWGFTAQDLMHEPFGVRSLILMSVHDSGYVPQSETVS